MKKRFSILILSILTFVFFSLGLIACSCGDEKKKDVKIVGFDSFTTTGSLNGDFSYGPYLTAEDEEGDTYLGVATVFDDEENVVETAYNRFSLSKLGTYTVKITVSLPDKSTIDRTITIQVIDDSRFSFTFSNTSYGYVLEGEPIVLPTATGTRATGETKEAVVKVYNDDDEEQPIVDGTFTAEKAGKYDIVAEIVDDNGLEFKASLPINVAAIPELAPSVLEDFSRENAEYSISGAVRFDDTTVGTISTNVADKNNVYKSEVGYASMYYGNGCIVLRFGQTENELKAIYDELGSITVRALFTHGENETFSFNMLGCQKTVETNVWTEIEITKEMLQTRINKSATMTDDEIKDSFAKAFSIKGNGVANSDTEDKTDDVRFLSASIADSKVSAKIYIEKITYSLELVDFENKRIGVDIGSTFDVSPYMVVKDVKGNSYTPVVNVVDSVGETVRLTNDTFKVEDADGYVISLTVVRSDGTEQTRTINLSDKTILEDFTSAKNIAPGTLNSTAAGEYLASYSDKNEVVKYGVGKVEIPLTGSQSVGVRFDKTKAELVEMFSKFEGLTITMLVSDADVEGDIETTFFSQGNTSVKKTIAQNTWTDVYLTKAELFKYAKAKGKTEAEIVEAFAEAFYKEGLGRFNIGGWTRAISFTGDVGENSTVVYIDKITYKLPFEETGTALNTFTEKAELGVARLTTASNLTGAWLESYTANEITKYGVGQVSTTTSNLNFRFNKTAAELEAIFAEFDSIKFTICVVSGDKETETLKFFNGIEKTVNTNEWVVIELTKAEIYNACKGGIKAVDADEFSTDDNIWSVFAAILGNEGAGQYMWKNDYGDAEWTRVMKFSEESTSATVYFDEIAYTIAKE